MKISSIKYSKNNTFMIVNGEKYFPTKNGSPTDKRLLKWIANGGVVEAYATANEIKASELLQAQKAIETHIYTHYTPTKQAQDEKWLSSYSTKLKALGVENLELEGVLMVTKYFGGMTLAEILVDIPTDRKHYYEKLIKVGIRTEWAELCIIEGLKAIADSREPNYRPYPEL